MIQTTLPPAAVSARDARRFISNALRQMGQDAYAHTACLLVSELVTNAILHAASGVTLRLSANATVLRVEVEDGSPVHPAPRDFSDEAATGRGLVLVEALAACWGSRETSSGKIVWFQLRREDVA